jgi:glutamyl-tRNA synthetase
MTVRTRFAPAPSGSIHVGNARTALFSWLTARHDGGRFVLRVEDTDASRVTEEAVHGLMESLRWLGIDWDEGPDVGGPHAPYRQSQRIDIYHEQAGRLVKQGAAYRCYCTPEELEERRQVAMARGQAPGYDGRCRNLSAEERAAFEAEGRPFALRFVMPERDVVVHDLVKGEVHFAAGSIREDFVILRSDGSPTFLLAVAVDDWLMEVTHVIRGDDLLPAAPRNIAVIEALGGSPPRYAHLPQVLGQDGKPLSKRHGSTSVEAFREQGFLPEALMNYLALLGWSKDEKTTFLSREELIASFDLSRVSRNPAAFDTQKLQWMNNHYIQSLDDDDLAARCMRFLAEDGLLPEPQLLRRAMPLVRERMKRLMEAPDLLRFLFTDDIRPNEKAAELIEKAGADYLRRAADILERVQPWTAPAIQAALDEAAAFAGLNRTKGWQPIRAAVTGSNVSPPLPDSLELLGQERTVVRLRAAAG